MKKFKIGELITCTHKLYDSTRCVGLIGIVTCDGRDRVQARWTKENGSTFVWWVYHDAIEYHNPSPIYEKLMSVIRKDKWTPKKEDEYAPIEPWDEEDDEEDDDWWND